MKSINIAKFKYITILFVLLSFITISLSLRIIKRDARPLQTSWNELFEDNTRASMKCKDIPKTEKTKDEISEEKAAIEATVAVGGEVSVPRKKPNYYAKSMLGWGPSAYLFDFLDDVLMKEITLEFDKIFKEAQKIEPDPNYKDPYSLESITQSKGTKGNEKENQKELLDKILSLLGSEGNDEKFNIKVWENSISCAKIDKILTQWKWYGKKSVPDPAKYLVDKYDFNGDGRLSPKEFIIAMIRTNKLVAHTKACKNCMEQSVIDFIDPIFMYLDCQNEEKINAEQLYTNIQKLESHRCKFFECQLNNEGYRTSSCNDFIIKAKKTMDGYVNKSEFRLGILTGYWMRHVDDHRIYTSDEKNMKDLRWDKERAHDLVCDKLKLEQGQ